MKILKKTLLLLLNALLALGLCIVSSCQIYLLDGDSQTQSGHEHIWGEWQIVTEATCTKDGEKHRICTLDSSHVERETIAARGHDLLIDVQDCTCTQDGYYSESCKNCDYSTYEVLEKMGHDICSYKAQEPTCTEVGWCAYEACNRCDYSTYVEIKALEHDLISCEAQAPTCENVGWEAYEACNRCDYATYAEIGSLGHAIVFKTEAPTCTQDGYLYRACSRCDFFESDSKIETLGHDLRTYESQEPTCTEIGWGEYEKCLRCKFSTYAEIAKKDHDFDYSMWKSADNITMTAQCKDCEAEIEKDVPNCEHSLRLKNLPWKLDNIERQKTYYVCEHCQLVFELSDVLCLTFSDVADGYRLTVSSKIPFVIYDTNFNIFHSEFAVEIESDTFSYKNDWREKRNEIKEVVFSENVATISVVGYYENLHTITFEESVKTIQTNALLDCFGVEKIYFEGDCPELEPDALWRANTAGHSSDFAPIVYYTENAKGFEDYGYKLQGCSLRMIGAETPETPEMTMHEYAQKTNAKSLEIATELFEKAAKTRPFLQFIPYCTLDKYKEIKDLALSLTQGLERDREKAKAIFDWIVANIAYDEKAMFYSVEQVFAERIAVCAGYAFLMHDMLAAVGIPSFLGSGIYYFGTDCTVQNLLNGDERDYAEGHGWLVCDIDGETIICDPTWGNFDISSNRLAELNLLTTMLNGISVIPDEMDPTLYASLLYYDGGELYKLTQGYVSNLDGSGSIFNYVVHFDFYFRKGNDGHDYGFSILDCQSAYSDAYMHYDNYDYHADFFFGADFRRFNFTEVLRFLAFEEWWYNNELEIEQVEEFLFDNGFIYHKNGDDTLTLVGTVLQAERIVIPDTVDGLKVVAIDQGAFANSYAKEFILPDTIEKIGAQAFLGCKNLETIVLPKNLKHIEPGAFACCYNLKSITMYAGVEFIGFKDNKTLVVPSLLFADIGTGTLKVYYQGREEDFEKIYFNNPYVDPFNSTFDTEQYEHVKQYVVFKEQA